MLWGIVLLLLSVAWLWIARLGAAGAARRWRSRSRRACSPCRSTARLNAAAWWDYENWSWFGAERTVSFQWNHDYGPLDWPREGTTLMTVQTETPLYWKASVLDRFDGYRWQRAGAGDPAANAEVERPRRRSRGSSSSKSIPGWIDDATFELRALTSDLVIGAGITGSVNGHRSAARPAPTAR